MRRQAIRGFVLVVLFLVAAFPICPFPRGSVYVFGAPWRLPSVIIINAYCIPDESGVSVCVTINGSDTGYMTPYAIFPVNGTRTVTVPNEDSEGHPFTVWSTGEKTPTITVTSGGTYTAYYGVSTYDVVVDTSFNDTGNVSVVIMEDGVPTGFDTPHTFTGLTGIHNFTVPSTDPTGHQFAHWIDSSSSLRMSTTITVSSAGTYTACYDIGLCRFVTPSDPAVLAVAEGKSWGELLEYVSSHIIYGNDTTWQLPSETLSLGSGQCRDYSTLFVSMLRACNYTAYVVVGTTNTSLGHSWVVIDLNGTLVHVEPQVASQNQQSINFTAYHAEYYFDENGFYQPSISEDPRSFVTQPDTLKVPLVLLVAIGCLVASVSVFSIRRKKKKRSFALRVF